MKKAQKVMATREPGGIAISEDIRTILHKQEYTMMEARTEALLYRCAQTTFSRKSYAST